MKIYAENTRVPIKSWCENPEAGAIKQAENMANLPFTFRHVALMPDTHQGFGMPIGGVLATDNVIIPNAVGVDIGCGMCSIESNIQTWDRELLTEAIKEIRYNVPVGFSRHLTAKPVDKLPASTSPNAYYEKFLEPSLFQLGTLGGGNHFIELQKNPNGNLCVMIHSGSRNIGKQVADYYNKLALALNQRYFSQVTKETDLAFLPLDSAEGQAYLAEMTYCVAFALANRMEMMNACQQAIYKVFKPLQQVEFTNFINIPHNYAKVEKHFGKEVVVHRKGATNASEGVIGLIPGSQGTKSYVVRGKGNRESFESCSHGAGRKMGRMVAKRTLNIEDEQRKLDELGVIHAVRANSDLDEAPGSYKDIDVVMSEQTDLIDVIEERTPLGVVKG
jgi:tRNA-splicing ligase RtcB